MLGVIVYGTQTQVHVQHRAGALLPRPGDFINAILIYQTDFY